MDSATEYNLTYAKTIFSLRKQALFQDATFRKFFLHFYQKGGHIPFIYLVKQSLPNDMKMLGEFFELIQEWRHITTLYLMGSEMSLTELNLFSQIRFIHLQKINLYNNGFTSIESFGHFFTPELQELTLSTNCIVSVKPLRKMYAPKLKRIYIMNNFIQQLDSQPNDEHKVYIKIGRKEMYRKKEISIKAVD